METYKSSDVQLTLSQNIKKARNIMKISQVELAELADISVGYMNDIERCRRWISVETLCRLSNALKIKPYQLFVEEDDTNDVFKSYENRMNLASELKDSIAKEIDSKLYKYI